MLCGAGAELQQVGPPSKWMQAGSMRAFLRKWTGSADDAWFAFSAPHPFHSQLIKVWPIPLRPLLSARLAGGLQPHHNTHALSQRPLGHRHQLIHLRCGSEAAGQ